MNRKISIWEKALIYLILIVFAIIMLYPIVYVFAGSLKSNAEIFVEPARLFPEKVTFENYKQIFANSAFNIPRMVLNSIIYSAWSIFASVLLQAMGAYVFARGNFPGKKIIFTIFASTMFIRAGAISIYCTFDIFRAVGLTPSLYTKMMMSLFSVSIVGYILIKGYIDSLPKELDESAKIDECGFIKTFFHIILPMLKPILATQAIFAFQGSWNDYIGVLMWTSARPQDWTLTVGVMSMRNSGDAAIGMGFTLAAAVISMIPVLIAFEIFNKQIVEGISAGAVKG